ncbi:AAA family ATPase [Amycolatopsis sp. OK19-0408]|uniref:AAA family ATPase n=1 Tax=Amycolatopsis iheyensis TaxID=2945988 RepID=A0A9X2NEF2_9PSEU|nr:AAA family ATPase [Amycolatopsis iheyensis]MCR6483030.1 AAA family ATPase [Amycolatopsis iheyensis]
MLERDVEVSVLDGALRQAAAGHGGVVVLEAAAGLGKTALLRHTREAARDAGCTVLSACGAELERDFTFGAIHQLFGPVLATASTDRLFTGAASAAACLFSPAGEPPHSLHPLLNGLYWLLVNLAGAAPVVVLVDDVQWLDLPSARYLGFLARRLADVPVLLVVASRTGEGDGSPLDDLLTAGDTRLLEPKALSETAVGQLIRPAFGRDAAAEFRGACHAATGGNPLLVRELVRVLVADGVEPDAEAAEAVTAAGPGALRRHLVARLRRRPAAVQAVASAVAVLGDGADLRWVSRQAGLSAPAAATAVETLVRQGFFEDADPPVFVHAVVREVVLSRLPFAERSAQHERAAAVLTEAGLPAERVASHLLKTIPAGDPARVHTLLAAAGEARAQGSPDNAAVYLRRALREPPPPELRSEVNRLLGNCEIHRLAPAEAETHLRLALSLADTPVQRVLGAYSLARVRNARGATDEAVELLAGAVGDLPSDVPAEMAAELEAELVGVARADIGSRARLLTHLDSFCRRPRRSPAIADAQLSMESILAGRPAEEAVDLARRALAGDRLSPDRTAVWAAVQTLVVADLLTEAERHLDRVLATAVRRGLLFPLAFTRGFLARVALLRGDLTSAADHVEQGHAVVSSPDFAAPALEAVTAHLLIEAGRPADADRVIRESVLPDGAEPRTGPDLWLLDARTRLRAVQDDPRAMLADARTCERSYRRWGATLMLDVPWRLRAADAHRRLGDRARAGDLVAEQLRIARSFGVARHVGTALRGAAALAATPADAHRLLAESADLLAHGPAGLELARTLTQLGSRLVEDGDRAAGRAALGRAAEVASRCGATALSERIARALGSRAGPRSRGGAGFTPAERQVVDLATTGSTNRQIAERLYLSEKTVEAHLSNAYRKAGVRSRTQLAARLAGQGAKDDC